MAEGIGCPAEGSRKNREVKKEVSDWLPTTVCVGANCGMLQDPRSAKSDGSQKHPNCLADLPLIRRTDLRVGTSRLGWRRIPESKTAKTIFVNALEIPDANERQAYVAAQCGADEALRRDVEQLLQHYAAQGSFLESPRRQSDGDDRFA